MVGSAEPVNGFLCLKTKKMYVLLHETVGSTEPTDGFLDPAMVPHLLLLGTAFWEAFNYVHHCTVVDAMRGPPKNHNFREGFLCFFSGGR